MSAIGAPVSHGDGRRIASLLASLADVTEPGRPVDQLTHSLQAARRAELDGADDELVVAVLCHDIGQLLPVHDHASVAAQVLDGHVRPEVVSMVAHHTELADGDAPACVGRPWLDDALRFVRDWDCPSFDPCGASPPLDHFRERVDRVFAHRADPQPVVVSTLLGGVGVDEFREDWFGRRHHLDRADRSRFDHLLDLARTEELVLRHHRDRVEVDAGGRPRDRVEIENRHSPVTFELLHRPLRLPRGDIAVFDAEAAATLLGGGSRVNVGVVDELTEPLARLAGSISTALACSTSVDAVATWHRDAGNDHVEATEHHLWVLHLAGERSWSVSEHPAPARPIEHHLRCGDALYIPAGSHASWADVVAPALHLVVRIAVPTVDVYQLLVPLLQSSSVLREDVPVAGGDRGEYSERVRRTMVAALSAR